MNIKQAKNEVIRTVRAYLEKRDNGEYMIPVIRQRPLLLLGAPGIGKTQIMEQVANECGIGLVSYTITHHTRQSAVGLPFIREKTYGEQTYSVTEYTMSEIIASVYEKIEKGKKEGILLSMRSIACPKRLHRRCCNFCSVRRSVIRRSRRAGSLWAAGNPPEYNKSVRDFDMVTLDRVRRIMVEPDYPAWKEYARRQRIHSGILSYLELRPQNFYRVQTDVDGMLFVTARGWEDLSTLIQVYETLGQPVDEDLISEFIQHPEVAKDVAVYLDLYRKYEDDYGIEDILQGKEDVAVYQRLQNASFDERLSVVNLLLSGLNRHFAKVADYKKTMDAWYASLKQMQQEAEAGSEEAAKTFAAQKPEFDQKQEQLIREEDAALEELENAFSFMENAFPEGQEMVVFVTELTMGGDSMAFLQDNPCEIYQKYNQKFMVGSKRAELLAELEEGKIRSEEHIRDF